MFKRIGASAVVLVMCVSAAVAQQQVATASGKGVVLVNRGVGFKRLGPDATLSPGDRVLVRPGGTATVTYSDGCVVNVRPGATVKIGSVSPCRVAESAPGDPGAAPGAVGGIGTGAVVGGLAGAGLVAAIVVLATRNGGNGGGGGGGGGTTPPISP